MNVSRYRSDGRRFLVVDAEHYVPDRAAFARRVCDPDTGVDPPDPVQAAAPDRAPAAPAASEGPAPSAAAAADTGAVRGADGVVFLALEAGYRPPRAVVTVVRPDGDRTPYSPAAARCGAQWAAERTDTDRLMLDTQAGTRAARVFDGRSVGVEMSPAGTSGTGDPQIERAAVVHEFTADVEVGP